MTELTSLRVLEYFEVLRDALHMPAGQSRAVLDEVRADLASHVQRHVEGGVDEALAIALALDELGAPQDLARQIRLAAAPQSEPAVRAARYAFAVLLGAVILWFFWHARAMHYGFSAGRCVLLVTIAMPMVLLAWPTIVWRKNWMFSAIPTFVIFAVVLVVAAGGNSHETSPLIAADAAPTYPPDPRARGDFSALAVALGAALSLATLYLLAMMQRRSQRLGAIVAAVLAIVMIEAPYAVEERTYERRLAEVQAELRAFQEGVGEFPARDAFPALAAAGQFSYHRGADGDHYTLFWNRPLSPGYALCYTDIGDRMWIND